MSRDAEIRAAREAAGDAAREAQNLANTAVNTVMIQAIETLLNGIPIIGTTAKGLGEGFYAAVKAPVNPVKNATSANDPIKLLVFMLAFAILKAIWCFIKSILNPLPIIGIFFPLCGDKTDPDNIDDASGLSILPSALPAGFDKRIQEAKLRADAARIEAAAKNPIPVEPEVKGITFAEFVARSGTARHNPVAADQPPAPTFNLPTSTNPPTTKPEVQTAEWEPSSITYDELRKKFGL